MKVLCHAPRAGPLLRLSDGTVMFDVIDDEGNSLSLFFADLEEFVGLVGQMLARVADHCPYYAGLCEAPSGRALRFTDRGSTRL